jgi:hypothetical protein
VQKLKFPVNEYSKDIPKITGNSLEMSRINILTKNGSHSLEIGT